DDAFEAEYVELLAAKTENFETTNTEYPFQGYYYPVRLNDTYGLLLDCSVNDVTQAQPSKCFAALKAEIERRLNGQTATIGQTWMISGWLPNSNKKSPEEIAQACYQALMPGSNWEHDLDGKGQFLGANIFELSRYRLVMKEGFTDATNIASLQENQHVIIVLYPDEATATNEAHRFYYDWMRLFSYRHKILWAYGQSRLLKETIKNYFVTVEDSGKSIGKASYQREELSKFRKTLAVVQDTLNKYTIDLNKLDFQGRTIDINLNNYVNRLERIETKAKVETELKFLSKFSKLVTEKYLQQIKKDTENLERGLRLLENTINAIRSRVEVDKAERDRNFQNTVTIIGMGWTVGSFVASLDKLGKDPKDPVRLLLTNSQLVPKPWLDPAVPLVYTLSVAIVAATLTWLVRRLWPRSS
ncbi:hypothetical protein H6S82_15960, partial [Planktothrix sp. FACHB-1355]